MKPTHPNNGEIAIEIIGNFLEQRTSATHQSLFQRVKAALDKKDEEIKYWKGRSV